MNINFNYKTETKTCYRFEAGERPDQITLYLKKKQIDDAGIDPKKGLTVAIAERKD